MAVEWIAAGHAPAAFWGQTPRAVERVLRATALSARRRLADSARAAWIGTRADAQGLDRMIGAILNGPAAPQTPEQQALAMQNLNANLGVITMDEYRARLKRGDRA